MNKMHLLCLLLFSHQLLCYSTVNSKELSEASSFDLEITDNFELTSWPESNLDILFENSYQDLHTQVPYAQMYSDEGCFIKAHIISTFFHQHKIKSGLIFIFPQTQKEYIKSISNDQIKYDFFLPNLAPVVNQEISWEYHTAAFIIDEYKNIHIFDHTLNFENTMTIKEWLDAMGISDKQVAHYTLLLTPPYFFGLERLLALEPSHDMTKSTFLANPTLLGCRYSYDIMLSPQTLSREPVAKINFGYKLNEIPKFSAPNYEEWFQKQFAPAKENLVLRAHERAQSIFRKLTEFYDLCGSSSSDNGQEDESEDYN